MNTFKFIDDHTGEEVDFNTIGVWTNGKRIGLAIDAIHSINGLYVDEDENLHLSRMSVGPVAHYADINKGEIQGTFDTWKLIKLPLEEIYERVREAS